MVECTALEMRHTGDRIQGSNPCLSAKWPIQHNPLKSEKPQKCCGFSTLLIRIVLNMFLAFQRRVWGQVWG